MSQSSENRFTDELKSAEERLKDSGRPTEPVEMLQDGMRLPYSSFPKLMGSRWKKAKNFPDKCR